MRFELTTSQFNRLVLVQLRFRYIAHGAGFEPAIVQLTAAGLTAWLPVNVEIRFQICLLKSNLTFTSRSGSGLHLTFSGSSLLTFKQEVDILHELRSPEQSSANPALPGSLGFSYELSVLVHHHQDDVQDGVPIDGYLDIRPFGILCPDPFSQLRREQHKPRYRTSALCGVKSSVASKLLHQLCDSFVEIERWDERVMILEVHPSLMPELIKETSFDQIVQTAEGKVGTLFGTQVIMNPELPEGHYLARSEDRQEPGCMQAHCTNPECVVRHVHEQ